MGLILVVVCTGLIVAVVVARHMLRRKWAGVSLHKEAGPLPVVAPAPLEDLKLDDESALEQRMQLEEQRDFLFRLYEKLNLSSDSGAVVRHIVTEVRAYLNVEICVVFRYNEVQDMLWMEGVDGVAAETFFPISLARGVSITGEVARTRQPVMINDLAGNAFYSSICREQYLKKSVLSVPVVFQDELVGVINAVDKKSGAPFRDADRLFMLNVARVGAIAFKNSSLIAQMQRDYLNTITTLALLIDARDAYTKRHSENVTRYAVAIAGKIGLAPDRCELIRRAGMLHDIGKIGIRDSVLLKPGKLTDEEFAQIKSHASLGADIVATLPALQEVAALVRHHHERYDGTGYPDGKKGEGIELGARILAVADTFDAMTTDRPYRKGMALQEALGELKRCKGSQFDPALVDAFLTVLEKDPGLLAGDQVSSPLRPARVIP